MITFVWVKRLANSHSLVAQSGQTLVAREAVDVVLNHQLEPFAVYLFYLNDEKY